jgi:hypothetical protein
MLLWMLNREGKMLKGSCLVFGYLDKIYNQRGRVNEMLVGQISSLQILDSQSISQ